MLYCTVLAVFRKVPDDFYSVLPLDVKVEDGSDEIPWCQRYETKERG
jgi:hypothetical protein